MLDCLCLLVYRALQQDAPDRAIDFEHGTNLGFCDVVRKALDAKVRLLKIGTAADARSVLLLVLDYLELLCLLFVSWEGLVVHLSAREGTQSEIQGARKKDIARDTYSCDGICRLLAIYEVDQAHLLRN